MLNQILPDDNDIRKICDLVQVKLGMKFTKNKTNLIISRLGKRIHDLELESYQQYLDLVEHDINEEVWMFNLLTTNVTQFFREPDQFEFLQKTVFPVFMKKKKDKIIRCWSAGCASGEEAYTLAMLMLDYFPSDWSLKVLASDISTISLQYGSKGIYTREEVEHIPKKFLKKYFVIRDPQTSQVNQGLRKAVFFKRINLHEELPLPENIRFDFIFCRNVFIYFSKETQYQVLDNFYKYLDLEGYLFLGHSEVIDTVRDKRWLPLKRCIFQKRLIP